MTEFQQRVLSVVKKVPKGRLITYKEIAKAIGSPGASRAVGNAVKKNPASFCSRIAKKDMMPCHRVIPSDGRLGGFAHGADEKQKLLAREGIKVQDGHIIDFQDKLIVF